MTVLAATPANERAVIAYLVGRDGNGWRLLKSVHRSFGAPEARKRLRLLSQSGLVEFYGRGRNRYVRLTAAGMKAYRDC